MIGLRWPRPVLAERIERRVEAMMAAGLLDEVERVCRQPGMSRTAGQALGYKELLDHLEGRIGLDEAVATIVTRTRQFAVRQERWFRRDPRVRWIDVDHDPVAEAAPAVVDALRLQAMTVDVTLTKHHGLGNDFLVVFHPARRRPRRRSPAGCATAGGASAPTGCSSARPTTATPRGWRCTTPTAAGPR